MREEAFDGFLIRGKFTDDSTEADWWFYKNGDNTEANKVSLAEYVDPLTKEFEYRQEEKPKTIESLFRDNKALVRIDELRGTENAGSFYFSFQGCTKLQSVDLRLTDTSSCTNIQSMFWGASSLLSVFFGEKFTCDRVTNAIGPFRGCNKLIQLDIRMFDLSRATNFSNFFNACSRLEEVSLNIDFRSATIMSGFFTSCNALNTINGAIKNLGLSPDASACPLTAESAQVLIDGLSTEAVGKTITFSATTKALLSEEQKAQIADKGWILG